MLISDYEKIIDEQFRDLLGKPVDISVRGLYQDNKCVALSIVPPKELPYYPIDKDMHITMALQNKKTPPVYSNELIYRLKGKDYELTDDERVVLFKPFQVSGTISFVGKSKK